MATISDDFASEDDHNCSADCATHQTRAQKVTHREKSPGRRQPRDGDQGDRQQ